MHWTRTQAVALSKRGFTVIGTDISKSAIERAKNLSSNVDCKVNDIFHSQLKIVFGFILDRRCLHAFPPELRTEYVQIIKSMLNTNGLLFLKCFSVKEKMHEGRGPSRFSDEDIQKLFNKDFVIESIKETVYQGTHYPLPKALFVVLKKK